VCLYLVVRWHDLHARPGIAYGTAAAMVVVTAVIGWLAVTGRAHRPAVIIADLAVTFC
jgi:hypothetical protein